MKVKSKKTMIAKRKKLNKILVKRNKSQNLSRDKNWCQKGGIEKTAIGIRNNYRN